RSKLDYEGQISAIAKVQGVIECTPDGVVTNANGILLELLGFAIDDLRGRNYSKLTAAETQSGDLWQALQRGESRRGEFQLVAFDKREVWVQGVFNPILDAEG